jgi:hypothetical protein
MLGKKGEKVPYGEEMGALWGGDEVGDVGDEGVEGEDFDF